MYQLRCTRHLAGPEMITLNEIPGNIEIGAAAGHGNDNTQAFVLAEIHVGQYQEELKIIAFVDEKRQALNVLVVEINKVTGHVNKLRLGKYKKSDRSRTHLTSYMSR